MASSVKKFLEGKNILSDDEKKVLQQGIEMFIDMEMDEDNPEMDLPKLQSHLKSGSFERAETNTISEILNFMKDITEDDPERAYTVKSIKSKLDSGELFAVKAPKAALSEITPEEVVWLDKGLSFYVHDPSDPEPSSVEEDNVKITRDNLLKGYLKQADAESIQVALDFLIDMYSSEDPVVNYIVNSIRDKLENNELFGKLDPKSKAAAKKAITKWYNEFSMNESKKSPKNTLKESFNDKENDFLRSRMEVEKAWGREKDGGVYYDEDYDLIESVLGKLENHEPLDDTELNWVKDYFEREKLWGREKDGGVYNDEDYDMMDNMIGQINESSKVQKFLKEEKVYDFTSNDYGLTEDEFNFIFDQLENQKYFMEEEQPKEDVDDNEYKLVMSILSKAKHHGWKSWKERHHDDD